MTRPDDKKDISEIGVHVGVAVLWGVVIAIIAFLASLKFCRIFDPSGTIWFIALGGFLLGAAYGYWHSIVGHKNN
jgi:membrane associated rhomboid family serine protease